MRFDKPIGIFLLLWPMLWALWVAGQGRPNPMIVLIFLAGGVVMRAAGCVLNDLADRNFDGAVARTAHRPLVTGQVRVRDAKRLVCLLVALAFALVCLTNLKTIGLSVAALLLAVIYPFTKRVTHWPQLCLGLAFAWAVPMAYTALQQPLDLSTVLLFAAACAWALAYDTEYAMADRDEDRLLPIKSSALRLGRWDRSFIVLMHALVLGFLFVVGRMQQLGFAFYLSLAVALGLAAYQQYLIRRRESAACLKAFLHNHYFGASLFLGLVLAYW